MLKQKLSCAICKHNITNARYCCDPKIYVCVVCSNIKCSKCCKARNKYLDQNAIAYNPPPSISPKIARKNKCCYCSDQQIPVLGQFFYEQKCKTYYCHSCILVFYQRYCRMINKFERQFGSKPEMQVELLCGCEIQTEKIVNYAKKYCFDCSKTVEGRFIILKNQCRIMRRCVEGIKITAQASSYNKANLQKAKSLWAQIKILMISCDSCKEFFDDKVAIAEKIGDIYICNRCLKMSKQYEQLYSKKSEQKPQRSIKVQQKSVKQQKQNLQSPFQLNKHLKSPLKCQICHVGITKFIEKQSICQSCFDSIDQGNNYEILEEHSSKSKIKPVNDRQIVKQKPQSQQKMKEEKQQNVKERSEQAIFQIQIPAKVDYSQAPLLKKMSQKSDEVQIECEIFIPSQSSNNKIHPEFYPPPRITLALNLPRSDTLPCSQCKFEVSINNSFRVYRRDANLESTSRIAETEEELIRYQKENLISIYCKGCYFSLKKRLKDAEKRRGLQRSEGGSRFGYSLAKREPKKDSFGLTAASKIGKNNDDYGGLDTFPRRFNDIKVSPVDSPIKKSLIGRKEIASSLLMCSICRQLLKSSDFNSTLTTCKDCEAKKGAEKELLQRPVVSSIYCKVCRKMVKNYDFNSVRNCCKACEMIIIEKQLKEKKQDDFKKVKCECCKKNYNVAVKQMGKMSVCGSCLTNAHANR